VISCAVTAHILILDRVSVQHHLNLLACSARHAQSPKPCTIRIKSNRRGQCPTVSPPPTHTHTHIHNGCIVTMNIHFFSNQCSVSGHASTLISVSTSSLSLSVQTARQVDCLHNSALLGVCGQAQSKSFHAAAHVSPNRETSSVE
jgi:hypothetical protein